MPTPVEPLLKVAAVAARQLEAVAAWHALPDPLPDDVVSESGLAGLILTQHAHNYRLWHHEDEARRTDVDDSVIAKVKRAIDQENQQRNDAIERIDDALIAELAGRGVAAPADAPRNSETPGGILDRLSILALKIYHMREQSERADADAGQRRRCAQKVAVLEQQRADLAGCLETVLAELAAGRQRLVVYRQFKMYNDPSLNPALYQPGGG